MMADQPPNEARTIVGLVVKELPGLVLA